MATGFITLFLGSTIGGLKSEENLAMQIPVFIRQLVIVLTIFFFFSWFWIKNGQTLGMQAWRIKLISTDGKNIYLKQIKRRGGYTTLLFFKDLKKTISKYGPVIWENLPGYFKGK